MFFTNSYSATSGILPDSDGAYSGPDGYLVDGHEVLFDHKKLVDLVEYGYRSLDVPTTSSSHSAHVFANSMSNASVLLQPMPNHIIAHTFWQARLLSFEMGSAADGALLRELSCAGGGLLREVNSI